MSTLKLKTPAGGSISLTPTDTASDVTLTLPAGNGTILVGNVSSSTINTMTNKVSVVIGGTTYYLLASTSAS